MSTANDATMALVAAYAVDALDHEERRVAEAALAADSDLRNELDDHYAVLAVLATAVDPNPSTPSPLVWEGIWNSIEGAGEVSPRLATVHDIARQRRSSRIAGSLSIAAILVAVVLGWGVVQLVRERQSSPADAAISALLEDPAATVVTLSGVDGTAAEARIVLGADGVGYLYADSLPVLDASRTYQLWAIIGDRVISAGVLGNDPDNSPFQVVGNVAGFAITDEVAGGVAVSEGETVAVWLRTS